MRRLLELDLSCSAYILLICCVRRVIKDQEYIFSEADFHAVFDYLEVELRRTNVNLRKKDTFQLVVLT